VKLLARKGLFIGLPVSFDEWVESLIKRSNYNEDFKEKIEPWSDAVQKRLTVIRHEED